MGRGSRRSGLRHLLVAGCLCVAVLGGLSRSATAAAGDRSEAVGDMVRGLRLVNWFPARGPHDRMWTAFDPEAIDRDLAGVAAMHANAVRVIPDVRVFTMPSPPQRYLDELSRTLAIAARHGLRVELTLFDQFGDYARIDDSRRWAEAMLSRFRRDPRIAFVELQNEIGPESEDAMRWARNLLPYVRELSGGIPVTVSVDAPVSNLVDLQLALGSAAPDFWDLHYYFLPGSAAAALREAAGVAAPKPLLIGEVGYSTLPGNRAVPGVPPTSAAQEAYQDYVLRVLEWATLEAGLPPAALWLVNDLACSKCTVDDFYGVFRVDGSAKPAASTMAAILGGAPVDRDIDAGFERAAGDDPAGWRTLSPGGATLRRDATVAHTGSASALIAGSVSDGGTAPCWATQPLLTPEPDGRYSLSAWVRGSAATGSTHLDLAWLDDGGRPTGEAVSEPLPAGDTGWTLLEVSARVPAGTVAAELRLCSDGNVGTAWFDDVRFEQGG